MPHHLNMALSQLLWNTRYLRFLITRFEMYSLQINQNTPVSRRNHITPKTLKRITL